jgi:outer membrane protein TolC
MAQKKPVERDAEENDEAEVIGPKRALSLDRVLEVAVRQSPQLVRATIDVRIARGSALAADGVGDVVLSSSLEYRTTRNPPVLFQPVQLIRSDTLRLVTRVGVPLPTGGEIAFEIDGQRENSNYLLLDPNPLVGSTPFSAIQYSAAPTLELRHPLLRNAGPSVARAERNRAHLSADRAELEQQANAVELVRKVVDGYWAVVLASETLKIRNQGVELARAQLKSAQAAIRVGAVPESTARAVGHRLALREQAVLKAEVELSERSLDLRRLVGLELGPGEIELVPADALSAEIRQFELDATLKEVLDRHPLLAAAEAGRKAAQIGEDQASDLLLPRLDLTARTGPRGVGAQASDVAQQIGTFDNVEVGVKLDFSYEIPLRNARGSRERSHQEVRKARLQLEEVRRDLIVETVQAVNRVRTAAKQVEVGQRAVELAKANLADEQARFRAGRANIFDVLNRQDELVEARAGLAAAMAEQRRAVSHVESLNGSILERYGIRFQEQ